MMKKLIFCIQFLNFQMRVFFSLTELEHEELNKISDLNKNNFILQLVISNKTELFSIIIVC